MEPRPSGSPWYWTISKNQVIWMGETSKKLDQCAHNFFASYEKVHSSKHATGRRRENYLKSCLSRSVRKTFPVHAIISSDDGGRRRRKSTRGHQINFFWTTEWLHHLQWIRMVAIIFWSSCFKRSYGKVTATRFVRLFRQNSRRHQWYTICIVLFLITFLFFAVFCLF